MCYTGAFGSGAAFALEDGWILARAIEFAQAHERPLCEALEMFDEIRSPYYLRMCVQDPAIISIT
jgi:salicylate hydroxylase